jgi:hypothetical protein
MICGVANSLWLAASACELARFRRAVDRVEVEQQAVLRRILRENSDTEFGRQHGFSSIRSAAEFQERVPLRDYEQHQPWIDRAAAGAPNILTREAIRLFEPTSGSSGAGKLIPYTPALQREFQRGIRAWVADLFGHSPPLLTGPAYWSVSPLGEARQKTAGGIPIGFDDDASYVGGWQRHLVKAVMAVPDSVRLASDLDAFRYQTLHYLVRRRDLRLISVWNPTFLSLLVDRLPGWGDRICHDLARGAMGHADPRRARGVSEALRAHSPQEMHARIWPKLGVISCWKDANAAGPAAQLAALFPHARMQGKGLISTEAFVSLPLSACEAPALAIRSHFLEFLPLDSDRPVLAHQLERGGVYTVVATTGGGLYRYQLGDQIEVAGHYGDCPLIRFVGRQASVSDWFGEKLNDAHVSRVMQVVFATLGLAPKFAMLACDTDALPRYVLYIDCAAPDDVVEQAAASIDDGLRANFHYDYARQLGQLSGIHAYRVRDGAHAYLAEAMRNGMKAGDVKAPALSPRVGWSGILLSHTSS